MRHEPGRLRSAPSAILSFHLLPVGGSSIQMKLLSASCAAGARGSRWWCCQVLLHCLNKLSEETG